MIFLGTFVTLKEMFWGLSNIPPCPSYHASQQPLVQQIYKI
jgi:hypothetical protein